ITRTGRAVLKRKLESIQESAGIQVEQVPAQYTSQECSGCGYTSKRNRPSRARYACRFCGKTMHADINAARVIQSRRSWQQPDNMGPKDAHQHPPTTRPTLPTPLEQADGRRGPGRYRRSGRPSNRNSQRGDGRN
ncbi:zinc ribbon domain-containing protein, partial [Bifidobacterium cuniculi]|uniref:zinc ribbon domain-containing protein n=1 Tax=Bifidobacterium cuniculi TaxID=1688 RepID=UPI00138E3497